MKKKYANVIIIGMMSLLLVGIVCATIVEDPESYSWWGNFLYNLQKMGLFTSAGIDRQCDRFASLEINPAQGDYYASELLSQAGCDSGYALIGSYDSNWNLLAEYRSEDVGILRKTNAGIIEVYCCPYEACTSDSDCDDPWGNTCNSIYGSCYYTAPSHSTEVYQCISGNWDYQRSDDYGDPNWCLDPDHNNYVREGQTTGGCYASPPSGWCVSVACATEGQSCGYSATAPECCEGLDCQNFQCVKTGECSSGQTKCGIVGDPFTSGEVYYTCVDGTLKSQGRIDGKCGYNGPIPPPVPPVPPVDCTDFGKESDCLSHIECEWVDSPLWTLDKHCVAKKLDAIISDVSFGTFFIMDGIVENVVPDNIVEQGERVIVQFSVKNLGNTGDYLLEAGIIPKSTATDWGLKVLKDGFWIHLGGATGKDKECCPDQPNIFASFVNFESGESKDIEIIIPKAPYEGIKDLCQDNIYWDGEGEYILYVTMKTGCWPEGEEVTNETKMIIINNSENVVSKKTKTITWTEFYSLEDKKILKSVCIADSECPLKKDYDVSCIKDDMMKERIYDANVDLCEAGMVGGLLGFVSDTVWNILTGSNTCELVVDISGWMKSVFGAKEPGICIAESTTWYGGLWETALKTVGGMGLPAQYIMLITLMILITLIGIIVRMIQ